MESSLPFRECAPVCIIAYNRADKIRKVVECLGQNELAPYTRVYIFSDAPKDSKAARGVAEVREYLRSLVEDSVESKSQDSMESNESRHIKPLDEVSKNMESAFANLDASTFASQKSQHDELPLQNLDSKENIRHTELEQSESEVSKNTESANAKLEDASTFASQKSQHDENLDSKENIESVNAKLDTPPCDLSHNEMDSTHNLDSKENIRHTESLNKNTESANANLDASHFATQKSQHDENLDSKENTESTNTKLNTSTFAPQKILSLDKNLDSIESKQIQNSPPKPPRKGGGDFPKSLRKGEGDLCVAQQNREYTNVSHYKGGDYVDTHSKIPSKKHNFKSLEIIEAQHNLGIKDSIVKYADFIFKQKGYDRFIGLEDDIETHKFFLNYMNDALEFYKDNPHIMAITAFTHQEANLKSRTIRAYNADVLFTYAFHSWGWGMWRDRWESIDWFNALPYGWFLCNPLEFVRGNILSWFHLFAVRNSQRHGKVSNLWDIYLSYIAYKQRRVCVWPSRRSYTRNFGFDGSGVHTFNFDANIVNFEFDNPPKHLRFTNEMNLGLWFNFKLSMLYGVDVWVNGFFKMFIKKIKSLFGK